MANQTGRLFFISHWNPRLEEFLMPTPVMNWTLPDHSFANIPRLMKDVPPMDGAGGKTYDYFWREAVDKAIYRANFGEYKNEKILSSVQHFAHGDPEITKRLQAAGETDPIYKNTSYEVLWYAMFQLSPALQLYIDKVRSDLHLVPGQYTAVHVRSRHPTHFFGTNISGDGADHFGLEFQGRGKQIAVEIATHALECAQTLTESASEPIYFFSDSSNLTDYMTHVLPNMTHIENDTDRKAKDVVSKVNVVGRLDVSEGKMFHLGRQGGRDPHDYFATFADLYVVIGARCLSFGTGGYGKFGAQITNKKKCLIQHHTNGGLKACPKAGET